MKEDEIVLKNIYCKTIHTMKEKDIYSFDFFLFQDKNLICNKFDFKYDDWLLKE